MKKENLDKIIDRVRAHLYEDAPTMNTASADGKPGFSSKADALGQVNLQQVTMLR